VTSAGCNSESSQSFGGKERSAMAGLHAVRLLAVTLTGSLLGDFKQDRFLGFLLVLKTRVSAYR